MRLIYFLLALQLPACLCQSPATILLHTINFLAIGLGGVMMVPAIQSMMPKGDKIETVVRIGVGESWDRFGKRLNLGGNTPDVRIFDSAGRSIGKKANDKWLAVEGNFHDLSIKPEDERSSGNRHGEYLSVSANGNNAICIAYVAVTWTDDQNKLWLGNWGAECGGAWYHSNLAISDDSFVPKCTWIDQDFSNNIKAQGIGIHITDFGATAARVRQFNDDRSLVCDSKPRFHLYDRLHVDMPIPFFYPPLEFNPDGTDKDVHKVKVRGKIRPLKCELLLPDREYRGPKHCGRPTDDTVIFDRRRSVDDIEEATDETHDVPPVATNSTRPVVPFMEGRLVTSKRHSAAELCESPSSRGADFVSHAEGMFCDMTAKHLWPLCSEAKPDACFDVKTYTMRPGKGLHGRDESSGRPVPNKLYMRTVHW